jgi:hypothetical protein
VELFERIRRKYEFGVGTIAGVAKKLGVHRRMVREAIDSSLLKLRKRRNGGGEKWRLLPLSWTRSWRRNLGFRRISKRSAG